MPCSNFLTSICLHKQRRLLLFITEVRRLFMIMVQEQNEIPFFLSLFFLNKRLRGMQVKEEVTGKEMKRKIPGRGRV